MHFICFRLERGEVTSHKIIIIACQPGSGGHEVAQGLSDLPGIPLYDRNLMEMAAEKMGHSPVSVKKVDEPALSTSLTSYQIPKESNSITGYGLSLNDSTYVIQTVIIEVLARKSPYVIVRRYGDYVLRDYLDLVDVFIYTSMDDRVRRIMERYNFTGKDAVNATKSTGRCRKNCYESYTKHKWGNIDSHQMPLSISKLGMDRTMRITEGTYESD